MEIAGTDVISSSRLVEVRQREAVQLVKEAWEVKKKGGLLTPIQGLLPEAPDMVLNLDKHLLLLRVPTPIPTTDCLTF